MYNIIVSLNLGNVEDASLAQHFLVNLCAHTIIKTRMQKVLNYVLFLKLIFMLASVKPVFMQVDSAIISFVKAAR